MNQLTSHDEQKKHWEQEHTNPQVLKQMDSSEASSGVVLFWNWLKERTSGEKLKGIEMGCGKGRNGIWLAAQGAEMTSFDFSEAAITEAQKRATKAGVEKSVHFSAHDATVEWPEKSDSFDFGIDCFASTDIESLAGRSFARNEFRRLLKPGGYLLVYTLSTDDEFHAKMLTQSPGEEKNSFDHPSTGKFEKVFDQAELMDFYKGWKVVEEKRIKKVTTFFGEQYQCKHFWVIFQKPDAK